MINDLFKIAENILTIIGLITVLYQIGNFLNKRIFKDLLKFREIIFLMKKRIPNDRNSGKKIDVISIPISQYDLSNFQNRYTIDDVNDYISQLETIKKQYVIKRFGVKNILDKLYCLKSDLISNNTFNIKMSCLIIVKIITDKSSNESFICKLCKSFRVFMYKKTKNQRWIK